MGTKEKKMFKKIILLVSLIGSVMAFAGHETGNGGDSHLSRYLLAKQIAEVITRNPTDTKLKEIFPDVDLYNIVNENISSWPKVINGLEFISVNRMLYEDGREKTALNIPHSDQVQISKAYFEKYNLSLEEVIINVIHESGHKLGITDHNKLDKIGSILVNKIYKYFNQSEAWQSYLILIDSSVQNQFDKRLKAVALEYVMKGDGIYLANALYYFTKGELRNANLAQMFKYMAMATLKVDATEFRYYHPDYWKFRQSLVDRFIKELILLSRTITPKQSNSLIKYGMAKLKISGFFYSENMIDFNRLADSLTKTMLDETQSVETRANNFKEQLRQHFFIAL